MTAPITQAQVFNAADAISAAGQQPTVALIRAKLGSGSYTTITAMLRTWRDRSAPSEEETLDVPEEVTEALQRAGQIVWSAAQQQLQSELRAIRTETTKTVASTQSALDEALAEIRRLEEAQDTLRAEYTRLSDQLAGEREHQQTLLQQIAAADATIASQNHRLTEQAALLARLISAKPQPEPADTAKPRRKPAAAQTTQTDNPTPTLPAN